MQTYQMEGRGKIGFVMYRRFSFERGFTGGGESICTQSTLANRTNYHLRLTTLFMQISSSIRRIRSDSDTLRSGLFAPIGWLTV
jgi:hypothetical protein